MKNRFIIADRHLSRKELIDLAQMATLDLNPESYITGMGPAPATTVILMKICDNDANKFQETVRLIKLIQEKTLQLAGV